MITILLCILLVVLIAKKLTLFSLSTPKEQKAVYSAAVLTKKMTDQFFEHVLYLDGIDARIRKMKRVAVDMEDDTENLMVIRKIKQMRPSNLQIYAVCHKRGMSRLYRQEGVILLDSDREIDAVVANTGTK